MKNEGMLDEIREALANDRDEAMRKRRVFRGRGIYKTETRDRALEHTRARIKAGITLRQIARDLGVNTSTLETWLTPGEREQTHQAPAVPRLRPVTIIGTPGEAAPAMTGATLVMPSGVRICGLTIDQLTAMAKVFG